MKVTNETKRLFTFNLLKEGVVKRLRFIPGKTLPIPKEFQETLQKDNFFLAHLAEKNLSAEGFEAPKAKKDKVKAEDNSDGYDFTDAETFVEMKVDDIRANAKYLDAAQLSDCIAEEASEKDRPSVKKALETALGKLS